jgi:outer membrane protein OmpA-like peptidoglycan-associated protein
MCPPPKGLLALAGTLLLSGCATVLTPRDPPLSLRTLPDSVTVRYLDGRMLGVAPIADLRLQPTPSLALDLSRDGWQPARVPVRRTLRISFGFNAIIPGVLAMGALEAGADPGDVLLLALAVPAGALVDLLTGAAWEHDPRVLDVTLAPLPGTDSAAAIALLHSSTPTSAPAALPPPLPSLPLPSAPLPSVPIPSAPLPSLPLPSVPLPSTAPQTAAPADAVLPDLPLNPARARVASVLLLQRMALAADEAGCDPVISETWLDESDLIAGSGTVSRDDSVLIGRKVQMQVDSARAELRALCSRSNPLLDSLRATRLVDPAGTVVPAAGSAMMTPAELCRASAFGHCITFASGSAALADEFAPALLQVAGRIGAIRLPVLIVIRGTADPTGDPDGGQRLGLARATTVRDRLVRLGVPGDWLAVESCGDDARCQLVPGAAGSTPGAGLNRRVAFHLRIRESRP